MEYALIWAAIGAGVCYYVAGQKGRNQVLWAALGAVFGIFAIIAIFVVSDESKQPAATAGTPAQPVAPPPPAVAAPPPAVAGPTPEVAPTPAAAPTPVAASPSETTTGAEGPPQNTDRMPCPNCGESIARAAQTCRFCGHDLDAASPA